MNPKLLFATLLTGALTTVALPASALIMTGEGNTPVSDAGWPEGALALANLKTRAGWWEGPPFGGGEWHFLYRGDNTAFGQALTNFAAIRTRILELVIHDGPAPESPFLKDSKTVNWEFTVCVPESWHRLYNNPQSVFSSRSPNFRKPVDSPRLDVYVGNGGLDWSKVSVPTNVHVIDNRVSVAGSKPAASMIRVEAFDMANGKPVRGARVIVASMNQGPAGVTSKPALRANDQNAYPTIVEGTTDETGQAEITNIPNGPHQVYMKAQGYAVRVLSYEQFNERTYKTFSTELSKVATIRGLAVDGDGNPLAGVKVRADTLMGIDGRGYLLAAAPEAVTDAAGKFELDGLPTGYCQLWAQADGFSYGDVTSIYDVPATEVTLRLKRAGVIMVRVTDKQGKALSRYENNELLVSVEPKEGSKVGSWGGGATVKDDGSAEMKDVPPGEYRITSRPNPANSNKEYTKEQIVTVKPGTTTEVRIVYE